MNNLKLMSNGNLSIGGVGIVVLSLDFLTFNYLQNTELEVAFFSKINLPTLADITMRLRIIDATSGDEVVRIQGIVDSDPDNMASIVAVADATEEFEEFSLSFQPEALDAILNSDAFNAANSLGRNKAVLALSDEPVPSFNADETVKTLIKLVDPPSYIALPVADNLPLYVACLRVAEKLNIPLDVEIDPTITEEQAAQLAESLDAQSHQVQLIWSPNICRPRDAVSLRGRKVPATYIGQYIGDKLLRNARTNAKGFAPIQYAVAWKDYPFKKKVLEQRPDIDLEDEQTLEMLAKAKVNVVRPIKFDSGVSFVLSDVLTQVRSKNSALRLVNASEIAMRTKNDVVNILKNHMLKPTEDYLEKASKEIEKYLSDAATSGWLKPAEELSGRPYVFRLIPDNDYPFERVRLYLARRPEGATRAVIFDEDVLVK
ncbi:hypothetical protein AWW72_15460 [Acinetobacter sp. NRRL B-65365]|uniref:hypothetical protein n=1 Tax=Acinetobacter sp. NRRL B-65365 TaxID=1785092 RepID=UPI0007A00DEA|nr:hypothetical protein [Acinetobacter sp. NRRL B-65365]KYQ83145.1 hypothetical protein AWW72_15460 [Acinetobacter sp. NRRL B-65365]